MTTPIRQTASEPRAPRARVGGRSKRVVDEVLAATAGELARVGYAELKVDEVARLAGVNKTTVYRRWPTKAELVGAAVRALRGEDPAPDTGSVATDLLALLEGFVEWARAPGTRGVARVMMLESDNPEVERLSLELRGETRARWTVVIERGVRRGELRRTTDPALLVEVVLGPVAKRLFGLRETVDSAYLRKIVRLVLDGARRQSPG